MQIKAEEISKIIRDQIGSYAVDIDVSEVGSIVSIGDGIARVHGIENVMAGAGGEGSVRLGQKRRRTGNEKAHAPAGLGGESWIGEKARVEGGHAHHQRRPRERGPRGVCHCQA